MTRRELAASAAIAPVVAPLLPAAAAESRTGPQPNIVIVISDQFRADVLGCMGLNPMHLTPNLDAMARRGVLFRQAMSSQPVCAPARATMFTGQYPAKHGVWKNGLGLKPDALTLAGTLRQHGYTANYIGKWHLSAETATDRKSGPVPMASRGGFADFWEASNALEMTSHPFEGDMFDGDGNPLHFSGEYRADFLTDRAIRFMKEKRAKDRPFLLVVSYLEVHHQNDLDLFVPPKKYAETYKNPWVPQDLRPLPGNWPSQLPGYYGCVKGIDDAVGTLLASLKEQGIDRDTIVLFTSDHGCHFRTRNAEYKRSPHESSIHIPLIVQGPGFDRAMEIPELIAQVDFAPTLLEAAGVAVPPSMQGRSALPLLSRKSDGARSDWRDEVYIEVSESLTGRVLRTPEWTYAVAVPNRAASSPHYNEYLLYDRYADPYEHVNLAGRTEVREISGSLRSRLIERIVESGGPRPVIDPPFIPYV
ncbi:MAG: sulfatase-like hydrolase/transferase [Acidobacteriota bacterium]|nr:sulfatase-like hydrolase/transferase [Acidobacteriota bacterium]